jgi:hypothetical protein
MKSPEEDFNADSLLITNTQVTCPRCKHSFSTQIWMIIDLGGRPDLAEQIVSGTLNTPSCPSCGQLAEQVDAPLLIYLASRTPRLIFSPSQRAAEIHEQAIADSITMMQLAEILQKYLMVWRGEVWRDAWLGTSPVVPRSKLPAAISADIHEQTIAESMTIKEFSRINPLEAWRQDFLEEPQTPEGDQPKGLTDDEILALLEKHFKKGALDYPQDKAQLPPQEEPAKEERRDDEVQNRDESPLQIAVPFPEEQMERIKHLQQQSEKDETESQQDQSAEEEPSKSLLLDMYLAELRGIFKENKESLTWDHLTKIVELDVVD